MEDDEYKLLNDPEYTEEWVEQELARGTFYFYEQLGVEDGVEDSYICDCHRAYGKKCLFLRNIEKEGVDENVSDYLEA